MKIRPERDHPFTTSAARDIVRDVKVKLPGRASLTEGALLTITTARDIVHLRCVVILARTEFSWVFPFSRVCQEVSCTKNMFSPVWTKILQTIFHGCEVYTLVLMDKTSSVQCGLKRCGP